MKTRNGVVRYPWDTWLRPGPRRRTVLRRGIEFKCLPHSIGVQIRAAAAKRGIHHIRVEITDQTVTIVRCGE